MSLATHDRPRAEREWLLWEWPVPMRGMSTTLLPYTIPPDSAIEITNGYVESGALRRRFGFRQVGSNLDGPVIHIARAFDRDGSERLFVVTTKSLYEFSYSTSDWVVRASNVFSGQIDVPVTSAFHVNGKLYIANGVNNLYEYDLNTNTGTFVGTSHFTAPKAVASIVSRLCVFNVMQGATRYPNRILYTPPGGSFQPSENVGSVELADPNDSIVVVVPFRNVILIRRMYSLWSMEATDETVIEASGGLLVPVPLVFRFEALNRGEYFEAIKAIFATNEEVYFIAGRELRRLRGGLIETVMPVGMTLNRLFEGLNDVDMRKIAIGFDFKSETLWISNPVKPNDVWIVRLYPRIPGRPMLTRVLGKTVHTFGYGTISFPGMTFAQLETNFGTFAGMQGVSFQSLEGTRRSALLLGSDNKVFIETETFSDSDGPIGTKWVTSLSNFGAPWYKVVERVSVLVERGDGDLTCTLGRSFDGVTIQWVGSSTKAIGRSGVLSYDFSSGEAPFWVVSLESTGVTDLKIGSILAHWRPTSPGR